MCGGFHYQGNSDHWPAAAGQLPAGAPVKVVDGVQRCVEAKAVNPDCYTVVRHHTEDQNPSGDLHEKARAFFATFVDESFRQIAHAVDAVGEWNEYYANSQDTEERNRWIAWTAAAVEVWRDEYRTQSDYAHIDLWVAAAAIGNDIPVEVAKLSHDNRWVVCDYHAYVPVWRGEIRPDDWLYYSGRWEQMDIRFRRLGYTVRWGMGEFGAVGHNGPGWPNSLAANDGWKHPDVYNGNLAAYIDMMRYWMDHTVETQAWKDGRVIGATIFTSGGGRLWRHYELAQPDMGVVARAVNNYMANVPPIEPPTDPPTPPPDCGEGLPRLQYRRRVNVVPQYATMAEWLSVCQEAFAHRESVGFSYDDAGIGDLENKTAILYGLRDDQKDEYADWFDKHYPCTAVVFSDYLTHEIVDIVDELPTHATKTYNTRDLDSVTDLIIHHTVSPDDRTAAQIAAYHVNGRGWPGIAYHYLIGADGTIEQTNYLETMSYHASAANSYSVGIALKGDFTTEHPTDEQLAAAAWLVDWLGNELDNIDAVYGHREAAGAATQCPGNSWDEWRDEVI